VAAQLQSSLNAKSTAVGVYKGIVLFEMTRVVETGQNAEQNDDCY